MRMSLLMMNQRSLPFLCELVREALEKQGKFVFRARGFSMMPFIEDGDEVEIEKAAFEDARFGDVMCYAVPQPESPMPALRVHRVLWKTKDALLVKGDTLLYSEKILPPQVFGKVTAIQKKRGWRKGKPSPAYILASLPFLYVYALLYKLKTLIVPEFLWRNKFLKSISTKLSAVFLFMPRAAMRFFT